MGLPKGKTNNRNGRPVGSKNLITKDLRVAIKDFLLNNFNDVVAEWKELEGKEKLNFYKELIKFSIAPVTDVSIFERLTDEQIEKIINELKETATNHSHHE